MKILKSIVATLLWLPWLFVISFYSFVIRAVFVLGRIPTYNNPDPKSLGFSMHAEIVNLSFEIMVVGLVLLALAYPIYSFWAKVKIGKEHKSAFLISIIIILFNITVDPFSEWFLD